MHTHTHTQRNMIWWTSIVMVGVLLLTRESCPFLTLDQSSLSAEEGSCVKIGCKAGHFRTMTPPTARLLWFKNAIYSDKKYTGTVVYSSDPKEHTHQDFMGSGRVEYLGTPSLRQDNICDVKICCLRTNDSGNYSFRYERDADKLYYITPTLNLTVQKNPCEVQFETTQKVLKESEVTKFNCSTSTSCPRAPSIKGLPERAETQRGNTSVVAKLTVDWKDNQRVVSCYLPLKDNCLSHLINITLNVEYSPRKAYLCASKNKVELGGSLTLNCSAMAVPDPTLYTWFGFSAQIYPDGMKTPVKTLHLQPVTRAHHGVYHCRATNALGPGPYSSPQSVEVLFPPDRPLLSLVPVATEGDAITINCSVVSWPLPSKLTLSWSSASDPSTHRLLHQASNTASLTTSLTVTSASAGQYACSALNSQGSNQTGQKLEVHYIPQNVSVKVEPDCEVMEETRLILFCEARSVPPIVSYTWTKTRTGAGQAEVVSSNQTLTIESASPADHGVYRCVAKNALGSRESPEVTVKVKYAPKHAEIIRLSGDEDHAGGPVLLSCRSVSYPRVNQYRWIRKLNNQSNEEHYSSHQNLTVDAHHPGIYYCIASNAVAGRQSNPVRLFLKTWHWNEIFWAIPFICIAVLAVIIYLVWRYKRNKLVSDGALDSLTLSVPVTGSADARGRRDDLLPNHTPSRTGHAFPYTGCASSSTDQTSSHAPQCSSAGPERLSLIDIVYSTVKMPTGMQAIREDHGYTGDEVNYASLHFASQGLSQGSSRPEAMNNDVHTKINPKRAAPTYENLEIEDNQLGDIEVNYSQVTFKAKLTTEARKAKKIQV